MKKQINIKELYKLRDKFYKQMINFSIQYNLYCDLIDKFEKNNQLSIYDIEVL